MFEWLEDKYGVRPVEGANGSFNNRETSVATCSCGAPKSVYVDNGEVCDEQSAALHAEHHGFDTAEAFMEATVASASNMAEAIFDSLIAPVLLESMLAEALGLPPGMSVRVIPITPEEAAAMGFPMVSGTDTPPVSDEDDWFNSVFGENQPPTQ